MNPAAFHPDFRPPAEPARPPSEPVTPISFLEPGCEGILFSVVCLLVSAVIYVAVLLFRHYA